MDELMGTPTTVSSNNNDIIVRLDGLPCNKL